MGASRNKDSLINRACGLAIGVINLSWNVPHDKFLSKLGHTTMTIFFQFVDSIVARLYLN